MATNDFLTFAGSAGSNVITQAAYAALAAQQTGFQAGVANSAQLNKVWRQSSIMAAVLGQFIADYSGQNAVDDGTTATLETNLKSAINAAGITAPQFDNSTKLATTAFVQRALGNVRTIVGVSSATSLSAAHVGALIGCNAPSNYTITLPPIGSLGIVSTIGFFHNYSSGIVTIAGSGAEKIVVGGANQSSIALNPGQFIVLSTDLATGWYVSSGNLFGFTQTLGDNSQNLATTAFVQNALSSSPSLGGNPTATTQLSTDNSTKIATTAFVNNAIAAATGKLINIQVFTSSGTYTPTPGTNSVIVEGCGGGGAGGGAANAGSGNISVGAGGGGGAVGWRRITSGFSGQAVTIGAGGNGVNGGTGGSGGATSFGSLLSLAGGSGGAAGGILSGAGTSGSPGGGGAPTGATVGAIGGIGFTGLAITASVGQSGQGASGRFGSGGGQVQASGTTASGGANASGYGCGGGGALGINNGAAPAGGSGSPGIIIVYEYS